MKLFYHLVTFLKFTIYIKIHTCESEIKQYANLYENVVEETFLSKVRLAEKVSTSTPKMLLRFFFSKKNNIDTETMSKHLYSIFNKYYISNKQWTIVKIEKIDREATWKNFNEDIKRKLNKFLLKYKCYSSNLKNKMFELTIKTKKGCIGSIIKNIITRSKNQIKELKWDTYIRKEINSYYLVLSKKSRVLYIDEIMYCLDSVRKINGTEKNCIGFCIFDYINSKFSSFDPYDRDPIFMDFKKRFNIDMYTRYIEKTPSMTKIERMFYGDKVDEKSQTLLTSSKSMLYELRKTDHMSQKFLFQITNEFEKSICINLNINDEFMHEFSGIKNISMDMALLKDTKLQDCIKFEIKINKLGFEEKNFIFFLDYKILTSSFYLNGRKFTSESDFKTIFTGFFVNLKNLIKFQGYHSNNFYNIEPDFLLYRNFYYLQDGIFKKILISQNQNITQFQFLSYICTKLDLITLENDLEIYSCGREQETNQTKNSLETFLNVELPSLKKCDKFKELINNFNTIDLDIKQNYHKILVDKDDCIIYKYYISKTDFLFIIIRIDSYDYTNLKFENTFKIMENCDKIFEMIEKIEDLNQCIDFWKGFSSALNKFSAMLKNYEIKTLEPIKIQTTNKNFNILMYYDKIINCLVENLLIENFKRCVFHEELVLSIINDVSKKLLKKISEIERKFENHIGNESDLITCEQHENQSYKDLKKNIGLQLNAKMKILNRLSSSLKNEKDIIVSLGFFLRSFDPSILEIYKKIENVLLKSNEL